MSPSGCSWSHGLPRRLRSPTERTERVVATQVSIPFHKTRVTRGRGPGRITRARTRTQRAAFYTFARKSAISIKMQSYCTRIAARPPLSQPDSRRSAVTITHGPERRVPTHERPARAHELAKAQAAPSRSAHDPGHRRRHFRQDPSLVPILDKAQPVGRQVVLASQLVQKSARALKANAPPGPTVPGARGKRDVEQHTALSAHVRGSAVQRAAVEADRVAHIRQGHTAC